jgi:transposase
VVATGESGRFPPVGHDAAYGRWVGSTKISNGTRKGQGHSNNGHPSLEGASREAAQGASRCSPTVPRFSQRPQAKSHLLSARKAVAHKRARACYDMLRDLVPFAVHKALG